MTTDLTPIPHSNPRLAEEYDRLRESSGVHRVLLPEGSTAWLVTDQAEVARALADSRFSLNRQNSRGGWAGFTLPPALDANLLNMDPPDHTRLRRLVASAFTPARIAGLRPGIARVADDLLDALIARPAPADLVSAYCTPMVVRVIADLLGVPEAGRENFRSWTDAMLTTDPPDWEAIRRAVVEMHGYMVSLLDAKRRDPADDLLSALVGAEQDGDRLSRDELTSLAFVVLMAGFENSANLLASAVLFLLRRGGLGSVPVTEAIEATLRREPPAPVAIRRFPVEDVTIAGTTIPAGETVLLALTSATDRPEESVDVAFGRGPHYCIGAALARAETEEALTALARRLPGLALAVPVEEIPWRASFRTHGPAELLVRW